MECNDEYNGEIMASINDVPPNELIQKIAEKLKQMPEIKPPEWAKFVKTGRNRERPPMQKDWWYLRAAAVLRLVATRLGPIGVSKLRKKYGGRCNRGHAPDKFYKGSGNIIRKILQQLEAAKLLAKEEKDLKKGRKITPKGRSLLTKTAGEIWKQVKPKRIIKQKPEEPKPEENKEKEGTALSAKKEQKEKHTIHTSVHEPKQEKNEQA